MPGRARGSGSARAESPEAKRLITAGTVAIKGRPSLARSTLPSSRRSGRRPSGLEGRQGKAAGPAEILP